MTAPTNTTKVKTFEIGSPTTFDNIVNKWFEDNPNITILKYLKDTTLNDSSRLIHSLSIIYMDSSKNN